ncbi:MAG: hypothetical protein PHN18_05800 [Sulfurospirillaceae bacterium]|nr:hypothetical protein [Sulfurospirillaceae bacterium]MDD2825825.1 hypothetical protein [Sulfurospirillaceae bacterium]
MPTPSSVLYISPTLDYKASFDGKDFEVTKSKNTLIASRVFYNDIVIHSFKINANTSDEELRTLVEIKMYEEAGLDVNKRYKIVYVKKRLDFADTVLIEAFAIDAENTKESLSKVLKQEKYIDFLVLPFLSYETLYTHKVLAPKNDLFVYIHENEAFLALYKGGEYIATKSIFTLNDILKKLKNEAIVLEIEALVTLLSTKGLDSTQYSHEETSLVTALQNVFVELFTKINDVLLHNRSVYGFDYADRIFMSVANGRVRGLREFLISFGYTDSALHDFKLVKNCSNEYPMACILASYVFDKFAQADMRHNVTFFVRPPQFLKTQTGKLTLSIIAAAFLLSLYPLYLSFNLHSLQVQFEELTLQNNAIKKNAATYNAQLLKIKASLLEGHQLQDEQTKNLENITQSIDELYVMKQGTKTYTDFIVKINRLLKRYALMVRSIEQKGSDKMSIEVVATPSQRDTIAKFMEDLLKEGFIGVTTNEIRSDKELYISKIEIER